jgi:hypothetical protein
MSTAVEFEDLLIGYSDVGIDWNDAINILKKDRLRPIDGPKDFHVSDFGASNPYGFSPDTLKLMHAFFARNPSIVHFTIGQ